MYYKLPFLFEEPKPVENYLKIHTFSELRGLKYLGEKGRVQFLKDFKEVNRGIQGYPIYFPICFPPKDVFEPPLILKAVKNPKKKTFDLLQFSKLLGLIKTISPPKK